MTSLLTLAIVEDAKLENATTDLETKSLPAGEPLFRHTLDTARVAVTRASLPASRIPLDVLEYVCSRIRIRT